MRKSLFLKSIYKQCFGFFLVFVCCVACKSYSIKDPMRGVWKQTHFYHLENGDTLQTIKNNVHHKMYLEGYVMWTSDTAPDGTEWHGYGTYAYKNDTIKETLTSMSKSMKSDNNTYTLFVDLKKEAFKQVIAYRLDGVLCENIEVYEKLHQP